MSKKSIVKKVEKSGGRNSSHGLRYDFDITMENGDNGIYSTILEDQDYFIAGESVEYLYIPHGRWPKIKKPQRR